MGTKRNGKYRPKNNNNNNKTPKQFQENAKKKHTQKKGQENVR